MVLLDGKIQLGKRTRKSGSQRFAISPYPKELEHRLNWQGEKLLIRPIRPEDEPMLGQLLESLTADDSRMCFFAAMAPADALRNWRVSPRSITTVKCRWWSFARIPRAAAGAGRGTADQRCGQPGG